MQSASTPAHPKVIFLDAVGTLFGVRGSVGQVYGDIAREFGVTVDPGLLNQAFFQSFKAAGLPAFPDTDLAEVPAMEYVWWEQIASQTFAQAGVLAQFTDFAAFFDRLFHHFATAAPWYLYPDVRPALEHFRSLGISLGVLSNFDSRLYPVLEALHLADLFTSVTISTEVGAAKPSPQIFAAALQKHHCPASLAWHIGDSLEEDYRAARAAGLRAFWLDRK